mmetsp:Transcript_53619/g.106737  ORF Transcript_53619/g.106737 Transcript_53619/m.106737 type:complete len:203 (-) Transcript_53619:73-681(-)
MKFVTGGTIVQEITADGRVRDIVTHRNRTKEEEEVERREEVIRNLPEFKRERNEGHSLAEQLQTREAEQAEEEKNAPKEYNVHTIDEDEYEHYQSLEESERKKARTRVTEETSDVAAFENERKLYQKDASIRPAQDPLVSMQQQARERAAARARAEPTVTERLRGRVLVRPQQVTNALPQAANPAGDGGNGNLVNYASDSDE